MVFKTCASLREILDADWKAPRADISLFRNPSQHVLIKDSEFSLPHAVTHGSGERWCTSRLIQMVVKEQPEIRVLLDVGAQILDLSNQQVAKFNCAQGTVLPVPSISITMTNEWSSHEPAPTNSFTTAFSTAPYCVVYQDHAHTRGTDLKLPLGLRAAVTLGRCTRMRKLGRGLSVVFFAPLEVDRSIRAVTSKKDPDIRVTAVGVLCWAIQETWNDIQMQAPYWAQQGMNNKARYEALNHFFNGDLTH